jgi:hypothetical protein
MATMGFFSAKAVGGSNVRPGFSGRISKVFTTVIVFEGDFPLPMGIFSGNNFLIKPVDEKLLWKITLSWDEGAR